MVIVTFEPLTTRKLVFGCNWKDLGSFVPVEHCFHKIYLKSGYLYLTYLCDNNGYIGIRDINTGTEDEGIWQADY